MPARHRELQRAFQLLAVQSRILRTHRSRRISARGNGNNPRQHCAWQSFLRGLQKLRRESKPCCESGTASVVNPVHRTNRIKKRAVQRLRTIFRSPNRVLRQSCKRSRPGGRSNLVVHDLQFIALLCQLQNSPQEILPPRPEDPTRPKDKMRRAAIRQRPLPGQLRRAIHAKRAGGIVLTPRPRSLSREYVSVEK